MYCLRSKISVVLTALALSACTAGIQGGSITQTFQGISSAKVSGPTSIEINWTVNDACVSYNIYSLGSQTEGNVPIMNVTVPPATINSTLGVESERNYTFAVGCVLSDETISGANISQSLNTWAEYNGSLTATLDTSSGNPVLVLNWNYAPDGAGMLFDIYVQPAPLPNSLTTWGLTQVDPAKHTYSETKYCSVFANSARIGEGNCPPLVAGQGYMFKIIAEYPDGTNSTDAVGRGVYFDVPSLMGDPGCSLTMSGISADANTSALFLNCSALNIANACPGGVMTTKAYQGVTNGTATIVRTAVSDTLTGSGPLRIQPIIDATKANNRVVENLEVDYSCVQAGATKIDTVRYDGINNAKPVLKFNDVNFVTAPKDSFKSVPSFFGKTVAIGDFNCDGIPDLAVGMPDVSFNEAPYFNQNAQSGVVAIYYDYTTNADGSINSATPPQFITFRDMPANAYFGASLAAGNVNKDYHADGPGNDYACDDLIIGAPGIQNTSSGYYGEAYIFYGSPQKFPQPFNLSSLSINTPTCSGLLNNTVCSPVRLKEDMQTDFKVAAASISKTSYGIYHKSQFGFSVAYIRDFNGDGYGDVAIGDPYCSWDGQIENGAIGPTMMNNKINDVGCVYVYWGGPNGLQRINVGKDTVNASTTVTSTFVKVYPPIPQSGMHFGWSISGGGDVDGKLPVPIVDNSGNTILANGNDFVVGAPDFAYSNVPTEAGAGQTTGGSVTWGSVGVADPLVTAGVGVGGGAPNTVPSNKIVAPLNGAWATLPSAWNGPMPTPSNVSLRNSTGVAFVYLGRSSLTEYTLTANNDFTFARLPIKFDSAPASPMSVLDFMSNSLESRQNGSHGFTLSAGTLMTQAAPGDSFYNCGARSGWGTTHSHYSCLAGRNNFSIVYPMLTAGETPVQGFGRTVGIAGSKEQNLIALLDQGYRRVPYQLQNNGTVFVPHAQGVLHERILGDSLWEFGVTNYTLYDPNVSSPTLGACEAFSSAVTSQNDASANSLPCSGIRPVRSAIKETYSTFPEVPGVLSNGNIQADINRDGYADVIVGTDPNTAGNAFVYTYYGNYAADFNYADKVGLTTPYTTSANCNVNNAFSINPSAAVPALANTIANIPFQTFTGSVTVGTNNDPNSPHTNDHNFSGTYPTRPLVSTGGVATGYRLAFFGDTASYSGGGTNLFSYPVAGTAPAFPYSAGTFDANTLAAMKACIPQRQNYSTAPSAITTADVNDDRVVDGVIGFQNETSNTGMIRTFISSSNGGGGFVTDTSYNNSATSGALAGFSVAATNWRFLKPTGGNEKTRRDMFMGAPQQSTAQGAVIGFGAPSGSLFGNAVLLQQSIPFANTLEANYAKIIGDVNGDGYDDIWMPVKRVTTTGSVYYEGIVYFGSPFGPVSTPMCNTQITNNQITYSNGAPLNSADCEASTSGLTAQIAGTPVRLPQYFAKPTGVSTSWALRVSPAGDVDHDGKKDIIVFDNSSNGIYLIFGSDIGLVNGQPSLGPVSNHNPQVVTRVPNIISNNGTNYPDGLATGGTWPSTTMNAYAHGDFNGDGYEDIAIGVPNGNSTRKHDGWDCGKGKNIWSSNYLNGNFCGYDGSNLLYPTMVGTPAIGPPIEAGFILVVYGGPNGYQTPTTSNTDFDWDGGVAIACDDFYNNCYQGATGTKKFYQWTNLIYGSLTTSDAAQYNLANYTGVDAYHNPACQANPNGSNLANQCVGTMIPSPFFYAAADPASQTGSYMQIPQSFGNVMTVADVNGDGVDDLVVGMSTYYNYAGTGTSAINSAGNPNFNNSTSGIATNYTTSNASDNFGHGAALIYYGASNHGLVAPSAEFYLGSQARGVTTSNTAVTAPSIVFTIYPSYPSNLAKVPTAEPAAGDTSRAFGSNIVSGDFNGDGADDLAIASAGGTVYIYYGPICQSDNDKTVLDTTGGMYQTPNTTAQFSLPSPSCKTFSLGSSGTFGSSATAGSTGVNKLRPQIIQMNGTIGTGFATTLVAQRRGLGNIKNPGWKTSYQGASDLIIAGPNGNDPNASLIPGKYTGLGYVFFGHESGDPGFPTTGGIYVGNASYNGEIVTSGSNYFYAPMLLRPHNPDDSVGQFYNFPVTTGDLNGDQRMDVLFPTQDLNSTQDPNINATAGGGFRLFY